jgi:predicted nucleic acid-binding protein
VKLAADASALVAEALRDRGLRFISHDDPDLYITPPTWSEVIHEIGRRLGEMERHGRIRPGRREPLFNRTVSLLTEKLTVVPETACGPYEAEARDRIPQDPNDWTTVGLALALNVGIWAQDRHFFGCGVPVWTTQTLLTHVETGRARPSP